MATAIQNKATGKFKQMFGKACYSEANYPFTGEFDSDVYDLVQVDSPPEGDELESNG